MKNNQSSFVQQHIEKVVLGVAVLAALAVVFVYFLGGPYRVELTGVRGGEPLRPGEVWGEIATRARTLDARIKAPQSALNTELTVPQYTREFTERRRRPPLSQTRLDVPLAGPGLTAMEPTPAPKLDLQMVELPAPGAVRARGGHDVLVLERADPQIQPALLQLVGPQEPRDIEYISVSAEFPVGELAEKLTNPAEPEKRIPQEWWKGRLAVTAVSLVRQQQDPATGQWGAVVDNTFKAGAVTRIDPLPTAHVFGLSDQSFDPAEAIDLRERIMLEQGLIQQTPMPPTRGGWVPPDAEIATLSLEDQARVNKLTAEIEELRKRMARLQQRMGNQPNTPGAPPRPMGPPAEDMMPPDMGPGGPGGPAGGAMTPPRAGRDLTQDIANLLQQIATREAERARIFGIELSTAPGMVGSPDGMSPMGPPPPGVDPRMWAEQMGVPFDPAAGMGPGTPGAPGFRGMPGMPEDGVPVAVTNEGVIKVWTHDLTVQPDTTYRYAVVVHILNPLFQRPNLSEATRDRYYQKLALASPPSAWSEPVSTNPVQQFFLIAANANEATIEVFRYFNGVPESRQFKVRPGDLIGDTVQVTLGEATVPVDMNVDGLAVDLRDRAIGNFASSDWELLYLDTVTQQLRTRSVQEDQRDPDLIRLRAEKTRGQMALQPKPALP